MDYVVIHGAFDDVQLRKILDAFAVHHPRMPVTGIAEDAGEFVAVVTHERAVGTG